MISFGPASDIGARWIQHWSDWLFSHADLPDGAVGEAIKKAALPRILQASRQQRDDTGRFMDRGRFTQEVQHVLELSRLPIPKLKTLWDLWDFTFAMVAGYRTWRSWQSEIILEMSPSMELIPCYSYALIERWREPWESAGGMLYGAEQRMIAPRTSDIWIKLSRFGVPWPPFEKGCGLGLRSVRRREAIALGIFLEEQSPTPGWWDEIAK